MDPEITQAQAIALVVAVAALLALSLFVRPERVVVAVAVAAGAAAAWTGSIADGAIAAAMLLLAVLVGSVLRELTVHRNRLPVHAAEGEQPSEGALPVVHMAGWTNPHELTPREVDVLACLALGRSNDEIAAELFVSVATVKTHINHLFAKAQLRDRAQAVAYAYDHGLVAPPTGGDRR